MQTSLGKGPNQLLTAVRAKPHGTKRRDPGERRGTTNAPPRGGGVHSVYLKGSRALMPQPGSFHWGDGPHPIAQAQSSQARQVLLQHPWAMASPCAGQGGGAEGGVGHSLVREELQGSAAPRDLAQGVASALAEASCGG